MDVLWKNFSPVQSSYNSSEYLRSFEYWPFLMIVVKLYRYIDNDVGNLRKYEYFHYCFRSSRKA